MTLKHPTAMCSVSFCPTPAVESERGELEHWVVTVHYCYEHARELREGTPLGAVGLDPCRVEIEPKGAREPRIARTPTLGVD